jgi:predicted histone-like DNA-binding protein
MARIIYLKYQNKNRDSAAFGKWFARLKSMETLNTRMLANHISEHGSIYTPDVVFGVLEKFRSCLVEMLLNSRKVKIDGLGTFYPMVECTKGGAPTEDKFNVNEHIAGVHIRFLPETAQEENLSSREFLKKCSFIDGKELAGIKDDEPEP